MNQVISISLPSQMTKKVDSFAKQSDQTRSELIRAALRDYLTDRMENLEAAKSTTFQKSITRARKQMASGKTRSLSEIAKRYGV